MKITPKNTHATDAPGANLGLGKRILFSLILAAMMWFVADTFAFVLLKQRPQLFFYAASPPSLEEIDSFYERLWDERWGWNLQPKENRGPLGNRKGREYEAKDRYTIKTFGDSFTQGAVENDETFQFLIEEATGWECLNFGVGAYGTDQALIKYQDTAVSTRYTVLGILDENIGRLVMNSWMYYAPDGFWPKPRFVLNDDGGATLLPNPAPTYEALRRMADEDFLESLRVHNYWYAFRSKESVMDPVRWPVTPIIIRNSRFLARRLMEKLQREEVALNSYEASLTPYHRLYEEGSEGLGLMRYIVDEFMATARERGEVPIVVIFPTKETMAIISQFDRKPYQPLVDHLVERGLHFIDYGDVFDHDDFVRFYDGDSDHFGPVGNQEVADEIIRLVQELDAVN